MANGISHFALRQKRFHCKLRIWIQICQLVTIVCAYNLHTICSSLNDGRRDKHGQLLFGYVVCEWCIWYGIRRTHGHRAWTPQYLVDNLFCNHTLWAFCYHYHYRHNYYDLVIKFMKCIRPLKYSQGSPSKKNPTKPIPLVPLACFHSVPDPRHISAHQSSMRYHFPHALSLLNDEY